MTRSVDDLTSLTSSVLRLGAGYIVRRSRLGPRPEKLLELYEFEACQFCRKVRETLSELDLEAVIFPCPKGGTRFRPMVKPRHGKRQFPCLVDPNTGTETFESDEIIRHLYASYGARGVPLIWRLGPLNDLGSSIAVVPRLGRGLRARPSRMPDERLHLYSFEASPYCRLVREVLTELELPYVLHNVAKRSPSRRAFIELSGRMMVPYLVDPNEGVAMFESKDIVRYLQGKYGH